MKDKIITQSSWKLQIFTLTKQPVKPFENQILTKKRHLLFYKIDSKSLLWIALISVLFFSSRLTIAQTHTTVANGNWNSAATWDAAGIPPTPGGNIASSRIINIRHTVTYNLSNDIKNSGTIRIQPTSGTAAQLVIPSGRNIDNNATGKIYVINGMLTQFRFAGGGNSGTPQSGSLKNKGGYIEALNSRIEIAQDWTTEDGGVRVFRNSCLLTGQNFSISGTNTIDTIIDTGISIGWNGSGNFDLSSGRIHFQQARVQLAGTSGNFKLNSGTANGDIDYITLRNHITNVTGSGEIFASSSLNVPGGLNLDAYCVNPPSQYKPNGKFSGAQILNCILTSVYFPCTVCETTRSTIEITACDSVFFNDRFLTESGVFNDTILNAAGCDSVITLNLTINNSTSSSIEITACDSVFFNDRFLTESGIFNDTISNAAGCDSVITLNLTINNSTSSSIEITACDSVFFNDRFLTETGIYNDTISNAAGCDSIITLNLTINNSTSSSIEITACDSVFFNDRFLTESGVFNDTILNAAGCDSVITLNLTINNSTSSTVEITACDSVFFNNRFLTESGIFNDTILNAAGCDSVITLNLTINNSTSSTVEITACDSVFFNNRFLTESGVFNDTILNAAGCDSIITLNLTINNSTSSTVEITTCDSVFFNDTWLTVPGIYYDTVLNDAGCDSVITLSLKIGLDVDLGNDTLLCDCILLDAGPGEYYSWCDGSGYRDFLVCTSGTYCVTVTDGNGCKGADTIIVIINSVPQVDLGPDVTLGTGNSIILDAKNPGVVYLWSTNETTQMIIVDTPGKYFVTVTTDSSCVGSDTVNVDMQSGIDDLWTNVGNIVVYPNPNDKVFKLSFSAESSENIQVQIINNVGSIIHQEDLENFSGNYEKQMSFSDMAAGIYLLKVQNGKNSKALKIVIN